MSIYYTLCSYKFHLCLNKHQHIELLWVCLMQSVCGQDRIAIFLQLNGPQIKIFSCSQSNTYLQSLVAAHRH